MRSAGTRLSLLFVAGMLYITAYSQDRFTAQPPEAKNFPTVTGEFWCRSYGLNALTNSNLTILENGEPVKYELTNVTDQEEQPKNKRVVLLLENHWSAKGDEIRAFNAAAISSGIGSCVKPGDQVAVYSFDWQRNGQIIFPETRGFTSDTAIISSTVKGITKKYLEQTELKSDIIFALSAALDSLPADDGIPTAIFLFSDGFERMDGTLDLSELSEKANAKGVSIYAITYEKYPETYWGFLKSLCTGTYGEYEDPTKDVALAARWFSTKMNAVIQNHIGTFYTYSFESSHAKDGTASTLTFRSSEPAIDEQVTYNVPEQTLGEWIEDNMLLALAIGAGAIALVVLAIVMIMRNRKRSAAHGAELEKTKSELQEQNQLREKERQSTEQKFREMQEEQRQKEINAALEKESAERQAKEAELLQMMMKKGSLPKLFYSFEENHGEVQVTKPVFTIGRDNTNDFYMQLETVSRTHAVIQFNPDGTFTVTDKQSTNGTFVNGNRVQSAELKSGDIIHIGGVQITFNN